VEQQNNSRIITAVESLPKEKQMYLIHLDGSPALTVHEDILIKYRLLKGESLSEELVEEIEYAEERSKAYLQALSYLSRRPRSVKEVRQHLARKQFPEHWVDDALQRLQSQGYLDDGQFAKQWAGHRVRSQKKGSVWIRYELTEKGVSKEQISSALQELDHDAEYKNAVELARRRWKADSDNEFKQRQKLMQFLLRRGYTNDVVRRAVREVTSFGADELEFESPE
jgi:regulatory protein